VRRQNTSLGFRRTAESVHVVRYHRWRVRQLNITTAEDLGDAASKLAATTDTVIAPMHRLTAG
jgi:hypothetical protein